MPIELKPCPFCGGEATVTEIDFNKECDRTTIVCTSCGLTLHHERHYRYDTHLVRGIEVPYVRVPLDPDAVTAWNQRITIEAEPVRHGRWIPYHESDLGWDEYGCRCSECKIEIESKDFWDVFNKRCPNCGARMDGDAK